jgi:hypothetical protein
MAQIRARYEQQQRELEERESNVRDRLQLEWQQRVATLDSERSRLGEELAACARERTQWSKAAEAKQQALSNLVLVLAGEINLAQETQKALMLQSSSSSSSLAADSPAVADAFAEGLRSLRESLKTAYAQQQALLIKQIQQQESELRGTRVQLSTTIEEQSQMQQRLKALREQLVEAQVHKSSVHESQNSFP